MLPKSRRISRELLTHTLLRGRRHNSVSLLLTLAPNPSGNLSPSRFSFSVSKKVCRNATDRNKFRRRGYAVTQKYVKNIKPGFLCVFSFKKGSAKMTFVEMEKEIVNLLSDASVIE